MRNSPRPASIWIGQRRTPIDTAGEQVARRLEHQLPGVADRQERELGAAVPCPTAPRPVRAHGQHPAVAADRRPLIPSRLVGHVGEGPVFEGRIDLVGGQFVLDLDDDSPVLAEFRRGSRRSRSARAGPGSGPRAAAGLPSRCWPGASRRGGRPREFRRW